MKKISALLILGFVMCMTTHAQERIDNGYRKGYQKLMQRAFMDLDAGYGISDSLMMRLIPESTQEYQYLIAMSKHSNDSLRSLTGGYQKYLSLVEKKLTAQDNKLYEKFMYLSEFAEWEFAEWYTEQAKKLIETNPQLFCDFYKRANQAKLMKLKRQAANCN